MVERVLFLVTVLVINLIGLLAPLGLQDRFAILGIVLVFDLFCIVGALLNKE